MNLISVVVPSYNEQESLSMFYNEITKIAELMQDEAEFEFLFIDDGSKDKTLYILKEMSNNDKRVHYISFSRNFGKEAAIYAGLKNARGNYVVVMDADLQHPPKFIPEMYKYVVEQGYDCASTRRISRKGEGKLRSFCSSMFYKVINKISQVEIVEGAQDYRFMARYMVDSILEIKEYNRFSKGIFSWVGYSTKYIEYENVERIAGETKWSFWKLFMYSLEGIFAFSTAPLAIASFTGILFCIIAFVMMIVFTLKTIIFGDPVPGFPTIICVIFLIGGIQLFCTGIMGQYFSKMYLEVKNRPIYIEKEKK